MRKGQVMKTSKLLLTTALSAGLVISPMSSVLGADEGTVSPQRANVGSGASAGQAAGGAASKTSVAAGYLGTGTVLGGLVIGGGLAVGAVVIFGGNKDGIDAMVYSHQLVFL